MRHLFQNLGRAAVLTLGNVLFVSVAFAQATTDPSDKQTQRPTLEIIVPTKAVDLGVGRTNLQCAGYFRMPALPRLPQIVGGEQEQEKTVYSTGDFVYLDAGQQQAVSEGQEFHIIRPRGEPAKVFREKKGFMGTYVEEVGELKVVRVFPAVSVAQITYSCDTVLEGDFLTGVPDRISPEFLKGASFDRFKEPVGSPVGRIMMAKDGREMVANGDTIYVDIGSEDKIVAGGYLTIYRKVGTGNLNVSTYDLAHRAMEQFTSVQYRGGGFSNQAKRARELKPSEGMYLYSPPVTTSQIRKKRPPLPWKIIGEALILNVQARTATAIITGVAQEAHTGDYVVPRD